MKRLRFFVFLCIVAIVGPTRAQTTERLEVAALVSTEQLPIRESAAFTGFLLPFSDWHAQRQSVGIAPLAGFSTFPSFAVVPAAQQVAATRNLIAMFSHNFTPAFLQQETHGAYRSPDATPCGYLPFKEWDVKCHESPHGAYIYEFASAKTVARKVGIDIPTIVRRIDFVLAPDGPGYRARLQVTLNSSILSGGRSSQIPLE